MQRVRVPHPFHARMLPRRHIAMEWRNRERCVGAEGNTNAPEAALTTTRTERRVLLRDPWDVCTARSGTTVLMVSMVTAKRLPSER